MNEFLLLETTRSEHKRSVEIPWLRKNLLIPAVLVEGVQFPVCVASEVRRLLDTARLLTGNDCIYQIQGPNNKPELRAALKPAFHDFIAKGVFLRISPTAEGARVSRPRQVSRGPSSRSITCQTLKDVEVDIKLWYDEVQTKKQMFRVSDS